MGKVQKNRTGFPISSIRKRFGDSTVYLRYLNFPAERKRAGVRKEKLCKPRIMYNMMLTTISNIASVHFSLDQSCKKNNLFFTSDRLAHSLTYKTSATMPTSLRTSQYSTETNRTDFLALYFLHT